MKKITLTCPFTGCEFTALQDSDGNLYYQHAITGKTLKLNYNYVTGCYSMSAIFFKHVETVTFSEAAEILGVTRQRANAIALNNVIRPVLVAGKQCFMKDDVLAYAKTRKVGAPKKEV